MSLENLITNFNSLLNQELTNFNTLTKQQQHNFAQVLLISTEIITKRGNPHHDPFSYRDKELSKLFGKDKFDEIITRTIPEVIKRSVTNKSKVKHEVTKEGKDLASKFIMESVFNS